MFLTIKHYYLELNTRTYQTRHYLFTYKICTVKSWLHYIHTFCTCPLCEIKYLFWNLEYLRFNITEGIWIHSVWNRGCCSGCC